MAATVDDDDDERAGSFRLAHALVRYQLGAIIRIQRDARARSCRALEWLARLRRPWLGARLADERQQCRERARA